MDALDGPRAGLARAIPRRPRVTWWLGIIFAIAFALVLIPVVTADRWLDAMSSVQRGAPARLTVRVPPFAGYDTASGHTGGGGVIVSRGEVPDRDTAESVRQIGASLPRGAVPFVAYFLLIAVLAALFTHHTRRSTQGRLLRVQLCSLAVIALAAIAVKLVMMTTALSVLVVPVALFAMLPTLVLDRIVGLATGMLAALVVSLLVPFDVGVAVMLMVQAGAAGLAIAERPKRLMRAVLTAGTAATLFTAAMYPLMLYLTAGRLPIDELSHPMNSAWIASAVGPALATVLTIPLVPLYQLFVGEITVGKLVELEDLSNPLLKQIASKAPGTWQHSLMMANMAEIAANTIGANGRLVRVGAYYHDLGKSIQPKYFIENLEPGETSPHDNLPPDISCDAIFAHVTEGIVTARKAGLHERIIDFMHMHHGNGVLEYFWGRTREQGNPKGLSVEHFRYPGIPPQTRETAILSICDAVEAASRTLKKPEVSAIDTLVQRIVYGKLHLGQLDDSGLSMGDLRRIAESLRETIRHANHGRIEYPWQKAQQDASASVAAEKLTQTGPRLDSLDRPAHPDTVAAASKRASASISAEGLSATGDAGATPRMKPARDSSDEALRTTAPVGRPNPLAGADESAADEVVELRDEKPRLAELAATSRPYLEAHESDARMRRVTNPVDEKHTSAEVMTFAAEANVALADASRDIAASDTTGDGAAARTKAATFPPLKQPTVPPPIGRRTPTLPPFHAVRPPTGAPSFTVPPPDNLRPPARPVTGPPQVTVAPLDSLRPPAHTHTQRGTTSPPPFAARAPGRNLLDEMITLRPQYEERNDLAIERDEDGEVRIAPAKSDAGDTAPALDSSWARGLAARLEGQLDVDFGTETPVKAPTRAELQALMKQPPDVTKQQSLEELERLHRETRDRESDPQLELTRRAPYPTREIDDSDIEAAIDLAPPARRHSVGVAKKPPKE